MEQLYTLSDERVPIPTDDVMAWADWMQSHEKDRIVRQQDVGHLWVSTVFLGMDYQVCDGPPLLFESMIFDYSNPEDPEILEYLERCPTEELALEMHARAVAFAKERLS
jgi:hypothetical protein